MATHSTVVGNYWWCGGGWKGHEGRRPRSFNMTSRHSATVAVVVPDCQCCTSSAVGEERTGGWLVHLGVLCVGSTWWWQHSDTMASSSSSSSGWLEYILIHYRLGLIWIQYILIAVVFSFSHLSRVCVCVFCINYQFTTPVTCLIIS